jgi:hypothetical protein
MYLNFIEFKENFNVGLSPEEHERRFSDMKKSRDKIKQEINPTLKLTEEDKTLMERYDRYQEYKKQFNSKTLY